MPSIVATSSPAPLSASRSSSVPGVSSGLIDSVTTPKTGPVSRPCLDEERGCTGDVVAVQDRVLDGRGAPPGRQQREVQVDPARPRHGECCAAAAARRRRRPGSSRGASARSCARKSGSPGRAGTAPSTPASPASPRPASGDSRAAAAGRGGGRVTRRRRRGGRVEQRPQGRHGRRGRPGEDEPHGTARWPRGRVRADLHRRGGSDRTTPPRGSPSSPPARSRRRAGR